MGRLDDRVAIVTGAASGFGAAVARRFAAEGAWVVVADIDGKGAAAVAEEVGDSAKAVEVDVRNSAAVAALVAATESAFGGLDILVNNAGVPAKRGPVEDLTEEEFDRVFGINVKGVWLGVKHGVPALRRRGGGVIINTSSIAAIIPRPGSVIYSATKGAVSSMTLALAKELAPTIRVNAVMPVAAVTNFMRQSRPTDDASIEAMAAELPLKQLCEPEDVAATIAFLASDEARMITGVCLPVDGGRSLGTGA